MEQGSGAAVPQQLHHSRWCVEITVGQARRFCGAALLDRSRVPRPVGGRSCRGPVGHTERPHGALFVAGSQPPAAHRNALKASNDNGTRSSLATRSRRNGAGAQLAAVGDWLCALAAALVRKRGRTRDVRPSNSCEESHACRRVAASGCDQAGLHRPRGPPAAHLCCRPQRHNPRRSPGLEGTGVT